MSLLTLLEISMRFLQHAALLGSGIKKWPKSVELIFKTLRAVLFDAEWIQEYLNGPRLSFRTRFIIVTQLIPIIFVIILIATFKNLRSAVFACVLLVTTFFMVCSATFIYLAVQSRSNSGILAGSLALSASFLATGLASTLHFRISFSRKRKNSEGKNVPLQFYNGEDCLIQMKEHYSTLTGFRKVKAKTNIRFVLMALVLAVVGALIILYAECTAGNCSLISGFYSQFKYFSHGALLGIGGGLLSVAMMVFFLLVLAAIPRTQKMLRKLMFLIRHRILKTMLAAFGMLYIPSTAVSTQLFDCMEAMAPQNTELIQPFRQFNWLSATSQVFRNLYGGVVYTSCQFRENECPISTDLCPERVDKRVRSDTTISCINEAPYFLWPSATLALIMITCGVPLLFLRLINISSRTIQRAPTLIAETKDSAWIEQCSNSSSCCSSLFSSYKRRWRFYRLFTLFQGLCVVLCLYWLREYRQFLYLLVGSMYLSLSIIVFGIRPYSCKWLNIYDGICSTANFIVCVISVFQNLYTEVTTEILSYTIISVNLVPVLLLPVAVRMITNAKRKKAKEFNEIFAVSADPQEGNNECQANEQEDTAAQVCADELINNQNELHAEDGCDANDSTEPPVVPTATDTSAAAAAARTNEMEEGCLEHQPNDAIVTDTLDTTNAQTKPDTEAPGSTTSLRILPVPEVDLEEGTNTQSATTPVAAISSCTPVSVTFAKQDDDVVDMQDVTEGNSDNQKKEQEMVPQDSLARQDENMTLYDKYRIMRKVISGMDKVLDAKLASVLVNYMIFLALAGYVGLMLNVVGVLRSSLDREAAIESMVPGFLKSSDARQNMALRSAFGQFNTWTEMTRNCCCNITHTPEQLDAHKTIVETWKCRNMLYSELQNKDPKNSEQTLNNISGKISMVPTENPIEFVYIHRNRVMSGVNGFDVRDYCSKTFKKGFREPTFSSIHNDVRIRVDDEKHNIHNDVIKMLW